MSVCPTGALADSDEEAASLEELAGFAGVVAHTVMSFTRERSDQPEAMLVQQIIAGAVRVIPGAAAAGVMGLDSHGRLRSEMGDGDDPVAQLLMVAENEAAQGPCSDAIRSGVQVVVDDLQTDGRWPKFAVLAADLDARAMICTPLEAGGRQFGGLSVMSRNRGFAENADTPTMAGVFAAHAAIAMSGEQKVQGIVAALANRDVIGQAKGILMERFKVTSDGAFAILVRTSSRTNKKVREVADQLCLTGVLLPDPVRASRAPIKS